MNFISKKYIFNLSILLLLSQGLQSNYCTTDTNVLQQIKSIEQEYVGKGSFGEIRGNKSEVSKDIITDNEISIQLLNNELKVLLAFRGVYDLSYMNPNGCWYSYNQTSKKYHIKIKMDRMEGNMNDVMKGKENYFNDIWKMDILLKLSFALKKLHDRGIFHLDLKEQNIMMMNKFTPVLADFGMALLPNKTRDYTCGTPLFMAPEITNSTYYSKEADIFAMGMIFFQILNNGYLKTQNFYRRCSANGPQYTQIYCYLQNLVAQMTHENFRERPKINYVIEKLLIKITQYASQNQQVLKEYINRELEYLKREDISEVTKFHKTMLKTKLQEKVAMINALTLNGKQIDSDIKSKIEGYAQTGVQPQNFLAQNQSDYAIIGKEYLQSNQSPFQYTQAQAQEYMNTKISFNTESRVQFLQDKKVFKFGNQQVQDQQFIQPRLPQYHDQAHQQRQINMPEKYQIIVDPIYQHNIHINQPQNHHQFAYDNQLNQNFQHKQQILDQGQVHQKFMQAPQQFQQMQVQHKPYVQPMQIAAHNNVQFVDHQINQKIHPIQKHDHQQMNFLQHNPQQYPTPGQNYRAMLNEGQKIHPQQVHHQIHHQTPVQNVNVLYQPGQIQNLNQQQWGGRFRIVI